MDKPIYMYILNSYDDRVIEVIWVSTLPRKGETLRLHNDKLIKFYEVVKITWVYDDSEDFERVNVSVDLIDTVEVL